MATDAGGRQPDAPWPDWSLPEVVALETRLVTYEPPHLRNFESALRHVGQAVEFLMETDRPMPARALSPVLYVGDVTVTEGESIEATRHRFLALEPDRLEAGAAIALGWQSQPATARRQTGYRYAPPGSE